MIRKEKLFSAILALICTILLSFIYFHFVKETLNTYLLLAFPSFVMFLAIFTSLADVFAKRNVKFSICFLIQGVTGLASWISLVLCLSNISDNAKNIAIITFVISFIPFLISSGASMIIEQKHH